MRHQRLAVRDLDDLAWQTDKGVVLAGTLAKNLRRQLILLPPIDVIERMSRRGDHARFAPYLCLIDRSPDAGAPAATRRVAESAIREGQHARLAPPATGCAQRQEMLEHIERLKVMETLTLPAGIEREVHQNRLLKLARECGQMTAQHLRSLSPASLCHTGRRCSRSQGDGHR